ncbi:unnamed protein product [Parnassius apollo]|uniref:(apollo) hypothetical protein n=1 Tax=Parnassius apollo TaxID=110799 RepID=A0A8S3W2P7_PARAO|nr:unnamed protein product [Parnassius apollo]
MADEDEIDVLGDFSFNSCFAQNNQGIPSCSDREDTVHPQWLLDSTATNWYDTQSKGSNRSKDGPSRKLSGNNASKQQIAEIHTTWSQAERALLKKEMKKYGRNIQKISETLKTKAEAEIQALIEAEYGVNLETPVLGLPKHEEYDNIPAVAQEEVVMDDVMNIRNTINMVTTAHPTMSVARKAFKNKNLNVKSKKSLLKPNVLNIKNPDLIAMNPSEIFYEDELIIGSTESIGSETDLTDAVSTNLLKQHKGRIKSGRKIGNHRRKVLRKYDKSNVRSKNKELMKSPQGRQRIDSGLSEDSGKSPKLQIVLGSGQALPVSEGEQVIKIEKKKDSEPESDIEIDIDSDKEENKNSEPPEESTATTPVKDEVPIAIPLRKFEPMPKRRKKINLDGGGGCTIMHTAAGDLYEVAAEPRRERLPKKAPIQLIRCHVYNTDKPPPCEVSLNVSALIAMDTHGHTSRGEVMGLVGGVVTHYEAPGSGLRLLIASYCRAAAANARTHCDMDPVSQARAAEILRARRLIVCGWHHSHPSFPGAPSAVDLRTQLALQAALERDAPFLALITSQHWPPGRDASHYRCIHVEEDASYSDGDTPVGYQLNVKLVPDLTEENLGPFLLELRGILHNDADRNELSVNLTKDVCPQAGITYMEKLISSVSHHMRSAGYNDCDTVRIQLLQGIRDVFR